MSVQSWVSQKMQHSKAFEFYHTWPQLTKPTEHQSQSAISLGPLLAFVSLQVWPIYERLKSGFFDRIRFKMLNESYNICNKD